MNFSPSLPHFYYGHDSFFINFRLADSLPQHIINTLKAQYDNAVQSIKETDEVKYKILIDELRFYHFKQYEHQLDVNPYGSCVLKEAKIAEILYDKILSYDGLHYNLKCLSIMPNHVHLLISAINEIAAVDKWMQLIKGGSAILINKELKRSGQLWASESFDRYIRDEEHYGNSFNYTVMNPQNAGLDTKIFTVKPYMYRCDI